jgi:hypothetical protein
MFTKLESLDLTSSYFLFAKEGDESQEKSSGIL